MFRKYEFAAAGAAALLTLGGPASARQAVTQNPAEVQAGTYAIDPAHSKITWKVSHLGYSTYVGQFAKVEGVLHLDAKNPAASKINVTIDTTSVGTLNPALDKHVKSGEFLDVEKFPVATFNSTQVQPTGPKTAKITGDLTLRGVTRPATVDVTFNQAGTNPLDKRYSLGFAGEAKIKRSDFGITTYIPAVGDEVTLEIEAELKRTGD
ncbi:YceI family protein [Caulobacter sp. 17J80-11]|uniref:YceI family protein n=1 Tax=Caulobacter sp. 17J80-11 TaxID=2763502 RepID=UPI0016534DF7|nr:YceI family protein [Caulobacter sp. 17J80-11]MBC6983734.1 YceI family protein [Caulobacter sp. 17J80-11]